MIDEVGADIVAYSEHKINYRHKDNIIGMCQVFNGGEAEIRTQTGHNCHENVGRTHRGGTSLLLYGTLINQYNFGASGKDDTSLGRWVTMTLGGNDGITTRVVCGYNPCKTPHKAMRSTYQQHRRYYSKKEKNHTCPT